jgi:tRNA(Ile)-lysidine synthase
MFLQTSFYATVRLTSVFKGRPKKTMRPEDLIARIEDTIRRNRLLSAGDSVLVGFSGGPDSSCLLSVFHTLKDTYRLDIHALYVNHNLRPDEIPAEVAFCRSLCEKLGITFLQRSIDVASFSKERRMNRHEAARELRYRAFQDVALEVKAGRIALAHTADDQAETFIMRLTRGSGPAGLSGIPVMRGNIIRPLLEVERGVIDRFLKERDIVPATDSSNLKEEYFRNRVRMSVLPVLKRSNPNLIRSLCHTMAILQEEERYFAAFVTKTLMKLISRKTDRRIELFLSPMEAMETVILRRVLRRAIQETEGLRGIEFGHIEDIIGLIRQGRAGNRITLPRDIRVIREYALLVITSEEPHRIAEYELAVPGEAVIVGAGLVLTATLEQSAEQQGDGRTSVLLDADSMKLPLTVRPRRPGDHFHPLGFGGTRKVQDFFVDLKVPRDERDSVPIVTSGDDIVWIAGYRADDRFKVSKHTKKFLRLGIVKGKF